MHLRGGRATLCLEKINAEIKNTKKQGWWVTICSWVLYEVKETIVDIEVGDFEAREWGPEAADRFVESYIVIARNVV